ncbi:MAG TPA: hypothetical protein PKC21_03845 [Oligoflexia bacterium]|nr:hypothetical protein [Oligoflexia bacterium]
MIFCFFSNFVQAQSDYSHYPSYLEDIYNHGTVKRCFDIIPIENSSPQQARILDFSCPKELPCYQCSFTGALFRIESLAYYNGYSKTVSYLDGELRMDENGLWEYIILPPYDDERMYYDPTFQEEVAKNFYDGSKY